LSLLVGRQEGHPACKNRVLGCWRGYLSGARCRLAYGPADATATHCLASVKSRLVLPFWYRLTRVVSDERPLKRMYVWLNRIVSVRCQPLLTKPRPLTDNRLQWATIDRRHPPALSRSTNRLTDRSTDGHKSSHSPLTDCDFVLGCTSHTPPRAPRSPLRQAHRTDETNNKFSDFTPAAGRGGAISRPLLGG